MLRLIMAALAAAFLLAACDDQSKEAEGTQSPPPAGQPKQ
jgi:uncharacterized lipoprotein YajG